MPPMQTIAEDARWQAQGYMPPPAGGEQRLAFVGQASYFEQCSLEQPVDGLVPRFFDHRAGVPAGALAAELHEFNPHFVIVFRPEIVPPGFFATLPALTVGFLTEPLPRRRRRAHADLRRRFNDLTAVDRGSFDRIVSFDPLFNDTINHVLPVWRSLPLPVADSLYMDVRPQPRRPKTFFIGRSTKHREAWLAGAKHNFNILHIAHGIDGAELREFYAGADICLNIHNEPYPTFENRVALSLAAGHLVISEALSPTHGLEPNIDYVELVQPHEIETVLTLTHEEPDCFHRMRVLGRMKAEYFRASAVYPRLLRDLMWDFAAFGTERPPVG